MNLQPIPSKQMGKLDWARLGKLGKGARQSQQMGEIAVFTALVSPDGPACKFLRCHRLKFQQRHNHQLSKHSNSGSQPELACFLNKTVFVEK